MSTKTPAPHPMRITVRDLGLEHDTAFTGGRAGSDPTKYLIYTLKEVRIS